MKLIIAKENNALDIICDYFSELPLSKITLAIEANLQLNEVYEKIINDERITRVITMTNSTCFSFDVEPMNSAFTSEIDVAILHLQADGSLLENHPGCSFDTLFLKNDSIASFGLKKLLQARHIILYIVGKEYQKSVMELVTGLKTKDFPASILLDAADCTLILDSDAAKLI